MSLYSLYCTSLSCWRGCSFGRTKHTVIYIRHFPRRVRCHHPFLKYKDSVCLSVYDCSRSELHRWAKLRIWKLRPQRIRHACIWIQLHDNNSDSYSVENELNHIYNNGILHGCKINPDIQYYSVGHDHCQLQRLYLFYIKLVHHLQKTAWRPHGDYD